MISDFELRKKGAAYEYRRRIESEAGSLFIKFTKKFKLSSDIYVKLKFPMIQELNEKKVDYEDVPSFVAMFLHREFLGDKHLKEMYRFIMETYTPDVHKMSFYQHTMAEWTKMWETFVNEIVNKKYRYLEAEDYGDDLSVRNIIQREHNRFPEELKKRIESADKKFKKALVNSPWPHDKKFEENFPKHEYWWLYGNPKNAPWFKEAKK